MLKALKFALFRLNKKEKNMNDERKERERLEDWAEHWKEECSGINKNERKGKPYCDECDFKKPCDLAYQQIHQLLQQKPEGVNPKDV